MRYGHMSNINAKQWEVEDTDPLPADLVSVVCTVFDRVAGIGLLLLVADLVKSKVCDAENTVCLCG